MLKLVSQGSGENWCEFGWVWDKNATATMILM